MEGRIIEVLLYHHIFLEMFQSQNIYIYVLTRTKLRLFTL